MSTLYSIQINQPAANSRANPDSGNMNSDSSISQPVNQPTSLRN